MVCLGLLVLAGTINSINMGIPMLGIYMLLMRNRACCHVYPNKILEGVARSKST
jgi:hypothetical protein